LCDRRSANSPAALQVSPLEAAIEEERSRLMLADSVLGCLQIALDPVAIRVTPFPYFPVVIAKYTSHRRNGFCNAPVWSGTLETRGERLFAWGVLLMLCGLSAFFFVYGLAYAFLVLATVARQPAALSLMVPMLLAMWLGGLLRQGAERLHREVVVAGV
jgi:hypothetical protein